MNILVNCDNCEGLSTLLNKVECTIIFMMSKKHAMDIYNLGGDFDEDRLKNLFFYKRILQNRIYNPLYTPIKTSSLIARISELAFKDENCSHCDKC